ncbi:MAG: beta-ketoacyl-ACP synthase [Spirochaetales bacterium]|nr:beta-ketoacyl-ACP synthase [Spirochaetales bacterium]
MTRRVVVTGGSAITPIGQGWPAIEKRLREKRSGIIYMREWERFERLHTRLAAPALWEQPDYPRKKTRGMGKVAMLAVHAAELALHSAGLIGAPALTGGEAGVSFGSSTGNVDSLLDFYSMLTADDVQGITATTYIRSMPQTCAVNIGIFFGLNGRLLTTNTACTAGSLSIGLGYEAIKFGRQKVMVCGGAEELSPTSSAVFDTLYATSTKNSTPHLTPAPFDRDRDGLVIGEGSGALLLEELEHARARGAVIHAELVGFGTNTDGDHITQPNKETMEVALRLALEDAALSPDAIDVVNGHGTATGHGDVAESHATRNCFNRAVPIHTQKSYIGHTLGACGAVEAWMAINMMNAGWFAPNLNLNHVDPACAPLDYITGDGRGMKAAYVMSNNFAFGGINTSLIFKRWEG